MSDRSTGAQPFLLGPWTIRPRLHRVERDGVSVQLEPRAMLVLVHLASRPGEVFGREEILREIWGDVVVCEDALTRVISELRRVFEDDARKPRYIETIRKGGYRLVMPVRALETQASAAPVTEAPSVAQRERGMGWIAYLPYLSAILLAAVLVGVLLSSRGDRSPIAPRTLPLTTFPGHEHYPAIAPDGVRVAFSWDGDAGSGYDLYIQQVGSDALLQLTSDRDLDVHPAWSPEGDRIAFVRRGKAPGIYVVPAIGGRETRLLTSAMIGSGLDWSPDGRWLAFSASDSIEAPACIVLLSTETGETRRLTDPPADTPGDLMPAFSPDGGQVAFFRYDNPLVQGLYVAPVPGGEPQRLAAEIGFGVGIDWMPNGREIVFSASPAGTYGLWRLEPGGEPQRVPTMSDMPIWPSVAARGDRIVYEHLSFDENIYRLELGGPVVEWRMLEPLVQSTRVDGMPQHSPDGSRIAFLSKRSGIWEVWLCEADGSQQRRLADLGGAAALNPRWSPSGDEIACSVLHDGYYQLVRIVPGEGHAREILHEDRNQVLTAWSPDDWLYFHTHNDKGWSTWRVRPDGTLREQVLPKGGEVLGTLGERLVCISDPVEGLFTVLPGGGDPQPLFKDPELVHWSNLAWTESALFYTVPLAENLHVLLQHDFASARRDTLLRLPRYHSLYVSAAPDGRSILFSYPERVVRDLMVMEGFR